MNDYAQRFRDRSRQSGRNMHESKSGAGSLIPAGSGMFRLVGAVEIGKQLTTYNRNVITRAQIMLTWELSGSKWHPENGRNITKTVRYTNSDSSKAELFKMFELMDPNHEYSRIGEMIGGVFLGECFHKESGNPPNKKTYANFRGIKSPIVEDPATGELKDYTSLAAPLTNKLMGFMWDDPTLEDWDNLYIEGKWDDGGSRNVFQQAIRAAEDFEGSPIFDELEADGRDPYADFPNPDADPLPGSGAANRKEIEATKDRIQRGFSGENNGDAPTESADQPRTRSRERPGRQAPSPETTRAGRSSGW